MACAVNHVPQPLIDQLLTQVRDPRVSLSTIHQLATAVLQTVPTPISLGNQKKIKTFFTTIDERISVKMLSEAEVTALEEITKTAIRILLDKDSSFLGEYQATTTSFVSQKIEEKFLECVKANPGHPAIPILIRSYVKKFPDQLFDVLLNHLDPGEERNELIIICFKDGNYKKVMIEKLVKYSKIQDEEACYLKGLTKDSIQYHLNMIAAYKFKKINPNFESELVGFIEANDRHKIDIAIELARVIPKLFLELLSSKTLKLSWYRKHQELLAKVLLTENREFQLLFHRKDYIDLIVSKLLKILPETSRALLARKMLLFHSSSPGKFLEILNCFELNDEHQCEIINLLFLECCTSMIQCSISSLLKQIRIPGLAKFQIAKKVLERFGDCGSDFAYHVFTDLNGTNPDQSHELAKLIIYYTNLDIKLLFLPELKPGSPNHLLSLENVRQLAGCLVEKPSKMTWREKPNRISRLDSLPLLSDEEKFNLKWACVKQHPLLIEDVPMTTPGWLSHFVAATDALSRLGETERKGLSNLIESIVNLLSNRDSRSPEESLPEVFCLQLLLICARHEPMIVAKSPVCSWLLEKGDLHQIAELFVGFPFLEIIDRLRPLLVGEDLFHYAQKCCKKDPNVIRSLQLFGLLPFQNSIIITDYIDNHGFQSLKRLLLPGIRGMILDPELLKKYNQR